MTAATSDDTFARTTCMNLQESAPNVAHVKHAATLLLITAGLAITLYACTSYNWVTMP